MPSARQLSRVAAPGLFVVLALVATWPFALHPGSTIAAPMGGDVSISIANFDLLAREGVNPLVSSSLRTVGWPDGVPTTPGIDRVSVLSTGLLLLATHAIGSIAAHGVVALLAYILTGLATYGFVSSVTASRNAGFVAGIAYTASSNLTINVFAVTVYAHGWLFILPMWGFWRLGVSPSRSTAVIAGASYLPALFWTPYFALHGGVVSVACLVAFLVSRVRDDAPLRRRVRLAAVTVGVWLAGIGAYLAIQVLSSFADVPDRSGADHFGKAAHPLQFLLPGQYSWLWGTGPYKWLVEHVPRAVGVNLYLGVSVLALSAVGLAAAARSLLRRARSPMTGVQLAALIGLAVAVACFLFALPPKVLDSRIPMPGLLVQKYASEFRTPLRFVMPLLAGTAVLAGLGAHVLLARVRRRTIALMMTAALTVVIVADTWVVPSGNWTRVPGPTPALAELRAAAPGPAIHYLSSGLLAAPAPRACFVQPQHAKPLANTCALRLDVPMRLVRWDGMPVCKALRAERAAGLRYVIADASRPDVVACFTERRAGRYRMLARDRNVTVMEFL